MHILQSRDATKTGGCPGNILLTLKISILFSLIKYLAPNTLFQSTTVAGKMCFIFAENVVLKR